MKHIYIATLVFSFLFLQACGSGGSGNSSPKAIEKAVPGACSAETIAAANKLVSDSDAYLKNSSDSILNDLKSDCTQMKSLLGDGSCVALRKSTGETVELSYSQIATSCEKIQNK